MTTRPSACYTYAMAHFSRDTRDAAEQFQLQVYRSMTPTRRYALGVEMSDNARDIALAGLRHRLPGLSEAELMLRYIRDVMGWQIPQGTLSRRERERPA